MKLTEYINGVTLPFCNSIDADNPVKTSNFQSALSDFIDISYGDFALRRKVATDGDGNELTKTEIKAIINRICENVYTTNKYKYDTLYSSTVQIYDPIENYNMVEEGTDESTQTETGSHVKGEQRNSSSGTNGIGAQTNGKTDSTSYGSQTNSGSNSQTFGAQTNSETATDTKSVSPFNSNSYTNAEQVAHTGSSTLGSRSDSGTTSETLGAHTDSGTTGETLGAHTDNTTISESIGARSDTSSLSETLGSHTDTDSVTTTNESEHNFSRHGNIGVTTTQQMLQQQREVAMFNLYSVVANDILKKIAIVVY